MDATLALLDVLQDLFKFDKVAFFPLHPVYRVMYLKALKGAGKKHLMKVSYIDSQESASKNMLAIAREPGKLPNKIIFESIRQDAKSVGAYGNAQQSQREANKSAMSRTKSKSVVTAVKVGDNNIL